MHHLSSRLLATAAIAALSVQANLSQASERENALATAQAPVATVWQSHKAGFDYIGLTSTYTCDGLESKVRQLLVYLGARKDLKVSANGCGPRDFPMGGIVRVDVEFQTLAVAPDTAATPVHGYWAPLRVAAQRPTFIENGDCELVDQIHHLVTDNFSLRNLDYDAHCMPHDIYMDSFDVRGEVLRATPVGAG
jgi:hypothetical protein